MNVPTQELFDGVRAGDRTVLGRAITLVESNSSSHQEQAQELLRQLLPFSGDSIRVGVTGVPGAGKSTLIDALGCQLIEANHRVAVMAVDPSSSRSKGSILGDKTRMEELSRSDRAFIRPSPTGGTLGGVARKTRETMLLFEAAGYDVLLVETVGVGQSEITVRGMVDFFLLVLIAGAGDELQGLKKGIVELADAVVINKADGDNAAAAGTAQAEYAQALHYLRPATEGWTTSVSTASALTGDGVAKLWNQVETFVTTTRASGAFEERRRDQALAWLGDLVGERLRQLFAGHPEVSKLKPQIEQRVRAGELPVTEAAWELLKAYETRQND